MILNDKLIAVHNAKFEQSHERKFAFLKESLEDEGLNVNTIIDHIKQFQIAIPSWALGTGGTRFGRFPGGGEPGNLKEKIEDVGLLHALNGSSGAISLHIPWDIPDDPDKIKELAASLNISFDAVNSNTFQDQPNQKHSYKFGSLSHTSKAARNQAIQHNLEVIEIGKMLGSKAITVWLADGSSFPGQQHFRKAFTRTLEGLQQIYQKLPDDWQLFTEHKPYEPNFYSSVVQDWGSSLLFAQKLGDKARCLVDLGHHLPNANIEQVVSRLMMEGKLGGFHFNDSKYSDDDLTVGSIKPYQLFLIFNELVEGMASSEITNPPLAWMIDASHNVKDPLEDLLQSVEAIKIAYAQALVINRKSLDAAQQDNDPAMAQEILQHAFRLDLRSAVAEARKQTGAALQPMFLFRDANIRTELIKVRGSEVTSSGL